MFKSLRAQILHYLARPHDSVPAAPLRSAAAWRGSELRTRTDWQVTLTEPEREELARATAWAASTGKRLGSLDKGDFPLPTLAARIDQWRFELAHGRGFVLIRGAPIEHFCDEEVEIFYFCLGLHLGIPGAQNPAGDLLEHVRDQRSSEDVRLYRTSKDIAMHCDAADVVGLLCKRPAKSGGLSRIASSVTVFNELVRTRPDLCAQLFEDFWFDTKGEGGMRAFPIAPARHAGGDLRTFWHSDYYRSAQGIPGVPSLTTPQQELLDAYDAIANDPSIYLDMDLAVGDIQLLSNHTQIHARTAYEDWPEPERRRHLLRLWLSLPEPSSLRLRWSTAMSAASLLLRLAAQMRSRYD